MSKIKPQYINRTKCVVCSSPRLNDKVVLKDVPAYMGVTESSFDDDLLFDQTWVECEECSTFQLKQLLPLNVLYPENHFEPVGETWLAHHKSFADFVLNEIPVAAEILEIGGASGTLASLITTAEPTVKYLIVEPNFTGNPSGVRVVKGFIEEHLELVGESDAVVHSHVLEHLYNPVETVNLIASKMKPGAKMMISFPNLRELLKLGGSNALNFEHTYFADEDVLRQILNNASLVVESVQKFRNHSFFISCKKAGGATNGPMEIQGDKSTESLFSSSWQTIKNVASDFNKALLDNPDSRAYLFGAHVFSQGLLLKGVNQDDCAAILDNSVAKQGKRLYGTKLKVAHPESIEKEIRPVVALIASQYQQEIRDQLLSINPGTILVEPRPLG
jgi:2-polyprenyl-3-methyl-5-hydroxy-6-metoxy-1,4-benzoquinol methylase